MFVVYNVVHVWQATGTVVDSIEAESAGFVRKAVYSVNGGASVACGFIMRSSSAGCEV